MPSGCSMARCEGQRLPGVLRGFLYVALGRGLVVGRGKYRTARWAKRSVARCRSCMGYWACKGNEIVDAQGGCEAQKQTGDKRPDTHNVRSSLRLPGRAVSKLQVEVLLRL